jgi:hypothetical protein
MFCTELSCVLDDAQFVFRGVVYAMDWAFLLLSTADVARVAMHTPLPPCPVSVIVRFAYFGVFATHASFLDFLVNDKFQVDADLADDPSMMV